jgi:hypothetical protein
MILRLIPALNKLFSLQAFAIVYTVVWFAVLIFAWINWGLFSFGLKIAISVALVLTVPAISDLRGSR